MEKNNLKYEFKFKDGDEVVFDSFGLQGRGYVRGYAMMSVNPLVIVEVAECFNLNGISVPSETYPFGTISALETSVYLRNPEDN